MTPLHLASLSGSSEVVSALLAYKADVNARNRDGRTPLHWAAEGGYSAVVELLLGNKGDVNAEDEKGETPLTVAIRRQYRIREGEWPPTDGDRSADLRRYSETIDLLRGHGAAE
jgi:hypothetical protein